MKLRAKQKFGDFVEAGMVCEGPIIHKEIGTGMVSVSAYPYPKDVFMMVYRDEKKDWAAVPLYVFEPINAQQHLYSAPPRP